MSAELQKAMVLAAGIGKRLRPLTVQTAKPALPLMGRPLIEYILRRLSRAGLSDVVVNLHHHPNTVIPSLDRGPVGLTIHRSLESELLGTAGGLSRAASHFTSEREFLLVNADTLVDFDLDELVRVHRDSRAEATLLLRPRPLGSTYSTVCVGAEGRIERILTGSTGSTGLSGRDDGEWMFAGVWVLSPAVFDYLSGSPGGLETELLPRLIENRTVFACLQEITWITIDTPRRYLGACLAMARERLFEEDWNVEALSDRSGGAAWAGVGTRVAAAAELRGGVVFGQRCRVDKGAHLDGVVCWDDVEIPKGVRLENCVLTGGVKLHAGMELADRVVMVAGDDSSALRKREIRDDLVIANLGSGRTRGL